jgi:hypothetical protein
MIAGHGDLKGRLLELVIVPNMGCEKTYLEWFDHGCKLLYKMICKKCKIIRPGNEK